MDDKAPTHNMKAVIKETGLTPVTLRAWERRYGLIKPQRSPGGHRLYSTDEIVLLKWLIEKQKEGLTISRAVDLWRTQAGRPKELSKSPPVLPVKPEMGESMLDQMAQNWYEACLAFNEPEAELVVARALAMAAPEVVCTQVLQKGLAELGREWYAGKVSVQQEHFASALAARRLNALFAIAPAPKQSGRLLFVCPAGEYHDLALLMLAFILRWQGREVIYLGADNPLDQLDATLQTTKPFLVISAAQTLPGAASLVELADFLNRRSLRLAFGGGIFNHIDKLSDRIPGYFLGREIIKAPQEIDRLLADKPSLPVSNPATSGYAENLAGFREHGALIMSRVRQILQSSRIAPRHVEAANINFSQAVTASLILGEVGLLDYSVVWLNGFLQNIKVSPAFALQYYQAFHQAVKEQPGFQDGPLLDWLAKFETMS